MLTNPGNHIALFHQIANFTLDRIMPAAGARITRRVYAP